MQSGGLHLPEEHDQAAQDAHPDGDHCGGEQQEHDEAPVEAAILQLRSTHLAFSGNPPSGVNRWLQAYIRAASQQ